MSRSDFSAKLDALRKRVVEMEARIPADAGEQDPQLAPLLEELHTALEELNIAEEELTARGEELRRVQRTLEDERRRYRELFEFAPDGYVVTDVGGTVLAANNAAGSMLRTRADLLVGRNLETFVAAAGREEFKRHLQRTQLIAPVQEFELKLKIPRGGSLVVSCWLAAERNRDGEPISLRWMLRDVTDEKRNTERLRTLNVELERRVAERTAELANASRAKDEFLAALSHELRTPLTPVLTAAMALETDAEHPEEIRRLAEMIRSNVELEARLIEDLLDLTRLAHGKLQLHCEEVDLHDAIARTLDICCSDINNRALTVTQHLDAERCAVTGDSARIQQVLWNLLKNAVKFTPQRGSIDIRTEDVEPDRVRIRVTDSGIGMEPTMLRRAFNAFEQGGEGGARQFGGLGLGLTISRTLVEAHGGTLTAESHGRGRGSTFTIELPGAVIPAPPRAPATSLNRGGSEQSLRILLVEDHADTARLMARLLRRAGHQVFVAETVAAGLIWAGRQEIDLVISDLGLPDGSGCDLVRQLSQQKPIVAIALSGYGMEADIKASLDAGFRKHLTKPVSFPHLQAAIESLME